MIRWRDGEVWCERNLFTPCELRACVKLRSAHYSRHKTKASAAAHKRMLFSLSIVLLATPHNNELGAMQAAFSRFNSQGVGGHIERAELPSFLRYVVTSMNSPAAPQEQVIARSSELTKQLMQHHLLHSAPSTTVTTSISRKL